MLPRIWFPTFHLHKKYLNREHLLPHDKMKSTISGNEHGLFRFPKSIGINYLSNKLCL